MSEIVIQTADPPETLEQSQAEVAVETQVVAALAEEHAAEALETAEEAVVIAEQTQDELEWQRQFLYPLQERVQALEEGMVLLSETLIPRLAQLTLDQVEIQETETQALEVANEEAVLESLPLTEEVLPTEQVEVEQPAERQRETITIV